MTEARARYMRPLGGWKDGLAIAKAVREVMDKRGLNELQTARQLGISLYDLRAILKGLGTVELWIQERLVEWKVKGKTFSTAGTKTNPKRARTVKRGYRHILRIRITEKTFKRLARIAKRMGLTLEEFSLIAVERLMDAPHEIVTLRDAMLRVEKAKIEEALMNSPHLRMFLKSDVAVLEDLGAEIIEHPEQASSPAKELKQAVEQIAPAAKLTDDVGPWEIFGDD